MWVELLDPYLIIGALCWVIYVVAETSIFREMPRGVAATWIAVGGAAGGGACGFAIPARILPAGPLLGVSLVALPVLLALVMELVGRHDFGTRGRHSHLATWYGGGLFGLAAALGRIVVLRHLGAL